MPDHIRLIDVAGSFALLLECGALPADAAVLAAGHEPNGYFWEGVLEYLAPGVLAQVELDPEAGMFCARGDRAVLSQLSEELEQYAGFQFDD